jgi:hypothetical protein
VPGALGRPLCKWPAHVVRALLTRPPANFPDHPSGQPPVACTTLEAPMLAATLPPPATTPATGPASA